MAQDPTTASEGERTPPSQIVFHYAQSPLFRAFHADGVLVTPSLSGDGLRLTFFYEHFPRPQRVVYELNPDGSLGHEMEEERTNKEGYVREFEVEVILTASAARDLLNWLTAYVEMESAEAEVQDEPESEK